jgi:hypothetical protein
MRDLGQMTADDFDGLEEKTFEIVSTDPRIRLELIEVRKLGQSERDGGSFSLLWQGPLDPMLEQATYRVSQAGIGDHEIFLVPVAEKPEGYQYEAIFT